MVCTKTTTFIDIAPNILSKLKRTGDATVTNMREDVKSAVGYRDACSFFEGTKVCLIIYRHKKTVDGRRDVAWLPDAPEPVVTSNKLINQSINQTEPVVTSNKLINQLINQTEPVVTSNKLIN